MGLFFKDEYDDNNKYYRYRTSDGHTFYAHYRKEPEWLLHEYFTGVSINIKLRGSYIEFDPKPFNGSKNEFSLIQYDYEERLTPKQFDKIMRNKDIEAETRKMKKLLNINEIEKDPAAKVNKSSVNYAIFNSEVGQVFCYDYGRNNYEEFLTGRKCHIAGYILVFDYCDTGFDVVKESASGNDTINVEKVDKETFANRLDKYIDGFGSTEYAKEYITSQLRKKIETRNANLEKYNREQEEKRAKQKSMMENAQRAIDKYGIR